MNGKKPREIAAQVLCRREEGCYVEAVLEAALGKESLSAADRGLCQELVFGVVRWQATLDWLIQRKTNARPQNQFLQDLLRLGLYQIFWLDRIPDHAAVNETVELARRHGLASRTGFVNAVLRGYLREAEATRRELAALKTALPAIGYSQPDWLVERWRQRFGPEQLATLLEWNNRPPATFARVNGLKTTPAKLETEWRAEGVEFAPVHHDWFGSLTVFELRSHPSLRSLPSFQQGLFYIQDPSTLLAVTELAPRAGEAVLDLCAAPGGKLACLAQLMGDDGLLVAHDTSRERLQLVRENCQRLAVRRAEIVLPSELRRREPGAFDRVLIDAPCSNTGVLRRRVDLRWRVSLDEIKRLQRNQLDLLNQGAGWLKPGGTLVYSTCSLEPEENGLAIEEWLAGQPNFKLAGQRELSPIADGVDGAYVARLLKH